MSYPLSQPTQQALNPSLADEAVISNLGLYMTRYIDRDGSASWEIPAGKKRMEAADSILARHLRARSGNNPSFLQLFAQRWRATLQSIDARTFTLSATEKWVVGLGAKYTREAGLRLHHTYGFPFIPGSALKGMARAYATLSRAEALLSIIRGRSPLDTTEPRDLLEILDKGKGYKGAAAPHVEAVLGDDTLQGVLRIFGTQHNAGSVVFYDAVPDGDVRVETDLLNTHQPEYYKNAGVRTPPADYQSPVPNYFLAVSPGTNFIFGLGPRSGADVVSTDLDQAAVWLVEGLRELGIGAKTTSGYGRFSE